MSPNSDRTLGVVLAGGLARRMGGGDKCLKRLGDRTLLDHVVDRLARQISGERGGLALNANGDPARFDAVGLPVIPDPLEGFLGPLAGVLAGLEWARERGAEGIVTAAADTPFAPIGLVARLLGAARDAGAPLACAETHGRAHPTFGYWPVALADDLRRALVEEEVRKIVVWTDRHGCARASFDDHVSEGPAGDPFFNVNTPEDMEVARRAVAAGAIAISETGA